MVTGADSSLEVDEILAIVTWAQHDITPSRSGHGGYTFTCPGSGLALSFTGRCRHCGQMPSRRTFTTTTINCGHDALADQHRLTSRQPIDASTMWKPYCVDTFGAAAWTTAMATIATPTPAAESVS